MSTKLKFQEAADNAGKISGIDNANKLKLYALYKQVIVGKNETKRPGMFDMVGKAKWDAWSELGDMSKEKAEDEYISLVNSLLATNNKSSDKQEEDQSSPLEGGDILANTDENGVMTIKLNRPGKKNAISTDIFEELTKLFKVANDDEKVKLLVLIGSGSYFTAGNDMNNFKVDGDLEIAAEEKIKMLHSHFASLIDLKKPLIALVNGPAIGIGVTWLGLCDMVISSDKATFHAPFTSLGITPESCSSYTFPKIMGHSKAASILLFGRKLNAEQAERCGLVSEIILDSDFQSEAWKIIEECCRLPTETIFHTKSLLRGRDRAILHKVNDEECTRMKERWLAPDCQNAVLNILLSKQN